MSEVSKKIIRVAKYDDKSGQTKYDARVPVKYDRTVLPGEVGHKKMADIKRDVSRVTHDDLIKNGEKIDTNMTGKPDYTTIAAKVTAHHAALGDYKGTWDEIGETNTKLEALYVTLGERRDAYVTARGDLASATEGVTKVEAVLIEIGWEVRGRAGAPLGKLPAPTDLSVTTAEEPGQADVMCDKVKGAVTYLGEWATNANGPWTQFYMGTRSFCHAAGLPSGTICFFRMCAFGASGAGDWSEVIAKRVN